VRVFASFALLAHAIVDRDEMNDAVAKIDAPLESKRSVIAQFPIPAAPVKPS
jgi:hypothetical protein